MDFSQTIGDSNNESIPVACKAQLCSLSYLPRRVYIYIHTVRLFILLAKNEKYNYGTFMKSEKAIDFPKGTVFFVQCSRFPTVGFQSRVQHPLFSLESSLRPHPRRIVGS